MTENVNALWSLFSSEFPEEWKNDQEFVQYMSELNSYSIEKLRIEPDALRDEKRFVLQSTQRLAFNNYKTFIDTAECTREVFKEFVAVEDHVERLLANIPGVSEACKKFVREAQVVNSKRKMNSLALSRHTQLLEVLEIPQVMETCVRNGYYEEALDLSSHVRRMSKKHGHISIIEAIAADVESALDLMLQQLVQQLRGSIQLPACLRVVGFLRRMDIFSDLELRLKFLQARDSWLQSVLAAVPRDDPYAHITKTIELSRVHLFDIVTQYRAIFPDEDSSIGLSSGSRHGNKGVATRLQGTLFYTWVNEKIWQFLQVLEKDLSQGVGGRVDSVLSQSMYFGLSFGRVGADFRSLVVPVFVRVLLNSFKLTLRNGKHEFHESMKRLALVSPLRNHPTSSQPYLSSSSLSSLAPPPPHSLLDFPPLASLTNVIIEAFNALRQCAPLTGGPEVSQELRRLLESTVHDIVEYHKIEHGTFTAKNLESYQQMVRVVVMDFLPFVKTVFESLYSQDKVSQLALACSTLVLKHQVVATKPSQVVRTGSGCLDIKMELDLKDIAMPLRSVAPDVFEEMEAVAEKEHLQRELAIVKDKEEVLSQEPEPEKEKELQETVRQGGQAAASNDQGPQPSTDQEVSQPTGNPQDGDEELLMTSNADTSVHTEPLV